MGRDYRGRAKQLLTCIPDILNYKTLLYVGATRRFMQMINLFVVASYTIDVIEIWPSDAESLKNLTFIRRVIEGDVRDVFKMNLSSYDVVMWWHGPEHIQKKELREILGDLERLSKKLIVIACPWGVNKIRPTKENIRTAHLSYLYPKFFEGLGWETNVRGTKNVAGSNLLAWKKMK